MTATAADHPGLHHRATQQHAANANGVTAFQSSPEQHTAGSSSSQAPAADVEAAIITPAGAPGHDDSKDVSEPQAAAQDSDEEVYATITYGDIFKQFSILGWTAFGGPAAHIGLFQRVSRSAPAAAEACAAV